jgi:hypothetical protein
LTVFILPALVRAELGRLIAASRLRHGSWLTPGFSGPSTAADSIRLRRTEIELDLLRRQRLDQRARNLPTLKAIVKAWVERRDAVGGKADRRFTSDDLAARPADPILP